MIPLTVTIVAIAMLASQLACGQAASDKGQIGTQGTNGKPSGPAEGSGDSTLIPLEQPAVAPPSDALSNLAGGGYADPNYVPPKTQSKKSAGKQQSIRNVHCSRVVGPDYARSFVG
jgi:predicted small lipoprotein YifL